MKVYEYTFGIDDLTIDKGDIESLMGYEPGTSPDPFPETIEQVFKRLGDHSHPSGGFIILEHPEFDLVSNMVKIKDVEFVTEKIVTRMLRKARQIALFVSTAGGGIEEWTQEMNQSGDPVGGFVVDAFGSEIAEAAAEKIQTYVHELAGAKDLKITNRYSPGYCGWPVSDQRKLFSFLPDNFCGISLSESSLMHPIKSVSGMIGIGPDVRFQKYTCDTCSVKDCIHRRLRRSASRM